VPDYETGNDEAGGEPQPALKSAHLWFLAMRRAS
jgi:hypothetical protein